MQTSHNTLAAQSIASVAAAMSNLLTPAADGAMTPARLRTGAGVGDASTLALAVRWDR